MSVQAPVNPSRNARFSAHEKERMFYLKHFRFEQRPFTLVPDPAFIYWSDQHRRANSVLEFGIRSQAPITLLTGDVGCGKTTLIRNLASESQNENVFGVVSNAKGCRDELLQWVSRAFGVCQGENADYVGRFQRLQDFFIEQYASGRRSVLIFDEAQHLSTETLEELRLLVNINSGQHEVLQLILVGQRELREKLGQPKLRQLAQRVSLAFQLDPMSERATHNYICHRLRAAGGDGYEIDERARMFIYEVADGVPRMVNQICDMALLYAWGANEKFVDEQTIAAVINDGVFFGYEIAKSVDAA